MEVLNSTMMRLKPGTSASSRRPLLLLEELDCTLPLDPGGRFSGPDRGPEGEFVA